jgi:hypothetical protein
VAVGLACMRSERRYLVREQVFAAAQIAVFPASRRDIAQFVSSGAFSATRYFNDLSHLHSPLFA